METGYYQFQYSYQIADYITSEPHTVHATHTMYFGLNSPYYKDEHRNDEDGWRGGVHFMSGSSLTIISYYSSEAECRKALTPEAVKMYLIPANKYSLTKPKSEK